jgi:hypothetical protein
MLPKRAVIALSGTAGVAQNMCNTATRICGELSPCYDPRFNVGIVSLG